MTLFVLCIKAEVLAYKSKAIGNRGRISYMDYLFMFKTVVVGLLTHRAEDIFCVFEGNRESALFESAVVD